tara:strand:+ start:421 stop:1404 length:984 start_codon:yes stop_codon:yes gene_type:complete
MERQKVGRTDITISPIGLGCVTFGREIDEETSYQMLDYAVERGVNWFDTAEAYGGGNARAYRRNFLQVEDERETSGEMASSEKILGRWMRARDCRDQVVVCTKVSSGNKPDNIARALQDSLEHLQTDYIDIYKLHGPDADVPIGESLAVLNEQVDKGVLKSIGCSNFSGAQLREALDASAANGWARFEIIQPPYNLAIPEAQEDLFPLCRQEEIAVSPYSPLGAGFLAGKYSLGQQEFPSGSRFDVIPAHANDYFSERNFRMVEELRRKSQEVGESMVRLAMAWVMTHPDVTSVLVGTRKKEHIDNALEALNAGLAEDLRAEMSAWD